MIWYHDGEKLGVGDSFILNELGETVCSAGFLSDTILCHAIPREALSPNTRSWQETGPEIAADLLGEHEKLARPGD